MEVGAIPTEVETKTSSEDLKCPLCEKPPFWAPAELLKHLTSRHFAKQMADRYKLEAKQPGHHCTKEGRDKPYKMTSMRSKQSRGSSLLSNMGLAAQPTNLLNSNQARLNPQRPVQEKSIEEKSAEEKAVET